MIELIQAAWSPFCIAQRRILEYGYIRFKTVDIRYTDRSLVWRLTKERYYGVPIIRDGKTVIFEVSEDSQVIAKYLDQKFGLGLFPRQFEGLQAIVWRYIENDVEGVAFKLNDIYYKEFLPSDEEWAFLRHKERKFGSGCIDQWRHQQESMVQQLAQRLTVFEQMLADRLYLLDGQPRFVDFDLFGILGNFLYSGHYKLPALHTRLKAWHERMAGIKFDTSAREKLHP